MIDKDLTLDGNDKTITATGKVEGKDKNGKDVYTHDCFLCISKSTATRCAEILMKNLNIISTAEQDAILAQENYAFGPTVTLDKVNINCEGECLYSNGGTSTVIAYDCYFEHSGVYATGKDAVYYSAVIVGYAGSASLYNCNIKSFGNGAATFPSGGTINLNNTNIMSTFSVEASSSGYALYVWNAKGSTYDTYGGNAIINVHSGNVEGEFGFVHTSTKWTPEINIYSGTFDHDPTTYVEAGKFIEHSGSKWIVS